jgi:hypothetical protein
MSVYKPKKSPFYAYRIELPLVPHVINALRIQKAFSPHTPC